MNKKIAPHNPGFKASMQANGILEMLIYDEINDGYGVSAKEIKAQLDSSKNCNRVSVRINSPGGDIFQGTAIYNLLKTCGKPVDVFIDGCAASSASVVAMAGSTITMAANSLQMCHNAWSVAIGNADDLRKTATILDLCSETIAQTYSDRTGQTIEDVKAMMSAETWLTASDALAKGFCTAISENATDGPANKLSKTFKALSTYRNTPASLKNDDMDDATVCECGCDSCVGGDCSSCTGDCDDPNCIECPMQNCDEPEASTTEASNLSAYEARLRLRKLIHV